MTRSALAALVVTLLPATGGAADLTAHLRWYGQSAFRIDGPPVVYLDPFQLPPGVPAADVILITHDHFDHCSPADVARIRTATTIVVGPAEVALKIAAPVETIKPGETKTVRGITVKAVPAYNVNKRFHPKADGKVGYVVTVAGVTYYHAGDTDAIPEMAGLAPDVALLPVGGTYTMTADEAAAAARAIRPKVAVPMHFGSIVGSDADGGRFAALLKGSGVAAVVLKKE